MTRGRIAFIALVIGLLSELAPLPGVVIAEIASGGPSVDGPSFLAVVFTTNFLIFYAMACVVLIVDPGFRETHSPR